MIDRLFRLAIGIIGYGVIMMIFERLNALAYDYATGVRITQVGLVVLMLWMAGALIKKEKV